MSARVTISRRGRAGCASALTPAARLRPLMRARTAADASFWNTLRTFNQFERALGASSRQVESLAAGFGARTACNIWPPPSALQATLNEGKWPPQTETSASLSQAAWRRGELLFFCLNFWRLLVCFFSVVCDERANLALPPLSPPYACKPRRAGETFNNQLFFERNLKAERVRP